ncbi:TPM domain-containing protein [Fulvivirgaceae bacterium BMA12]|uniref:TPM domain-containing protein n=1 Tax=Agaribacillus aureus TaxID=3051825 RepID=A0ABT8L3M7_9BACT|nr:TPM domain-containing protein [Fulvivirgaceae bacterium BMA12]
MPKVLAQDLPERPNPPTLVNDFAEILNASQRKSLEDKLSNYNDSTSSQIAIVIIPSLNGYEVAQYAVELAEKWGIGQEGKDNGILILVAINDRRMNISTGYGVEAFVPDVTANRIIDRTMAPNFRNGNYFEGLDQATSILMALLSGQFVAEPGARNEGFPITLILVIMGIFFIIIFLRSKGGGGRGGGGFRPTVHTFGNPYRGRSSWGDFSSGGGSFGSGGFGGFGGGSFGGGGASGSW